MKEIASALVKAQKQFSPALKTSTNPHFKSRYADLSACVEAVIDALNNNGIALLQHCHDCDNGVIVETVFMHESGETYSAGKLHVPATKQDAQGYGSALTYGRRYSLMAACGIAPEDDDGNHASKPKIVIPAVPNVTLESSREAVIQAVAYAIGKAFDKNDIIGAYEEYIHITNNDEKMRLWALLPSNIRSALKKQGEISTKGDKQ